MYIIRNNNDVNEANSLKLNIAARVNYSLYMLKFQNVLSPEITNMWWKCYILGMHLIW
jgi:hypothetical protein